MQQLVASFQAKKSPSTIVKYVETDLFSTIGSLFPEKKRKGKKQHFTSINSYPSEMAKKAALTPPVINLVIKNHCKRYLVAFRKKHWMGRGVLRGGGESNTADDVFHFFLKDNVFFVHTHKQPPKKLFLSLYYNFIACTQTQKR